jgi:type I restriction-modification system DNA methylase subunit
MSDSKEISNLVERFDFSHQAYRSGQYNETQLRREFIDPFFKALGWDVTNEKGYAEAYKDVVHEDAIKIGGATKAPDYCFRIGGTRKFFVEAKKPAIDIKHDIHPAFQLRRYAWSAKLPLSILTDFEEFAVYDCRIKPIKTDMASVARTMYLNYTDYASRWDEIVSVFSRDAVLKGSFDKYVESSKAKRGTAEVDASFLREIERWRELLARNIALRNPELSPRELNFAVQRTIDRIIFLRICEDRGIEIYGRLMALRNGTRVYQRLYELFYRADERYNSGLFHFQREKGRPEPPDELTQDLTVDDKPLKEIVKNLYYPDSPYEFSVLPADILGQVYEQFLGKVIRLTTGHRAMVEDKPEVKKAGGVYYTPTYIVDYIVKNTVGKLVEKKSPRQVTKLRILDPACGSGSFLIGAYQYLLDWHRDWYVNDDTPKWATGREPRLYQASGGDWRLTTVERKRILLNNIYGVDIDPQAVEVTKLSLLLKVLEGENEQTLTKQLKLFHERALPDLSYNIKCGNSLIGPDFYDNQQMSFLDEEERYRINVFDWEAEFPEIMQVGGFDAVIGNPPYGFHQIHSEMNKPYFKSHYSSSEGSYEHYFLFYEASLKLLRNNGFHGFIVPVTWLTIPSATSVRKFILENFAIRSISWLPELVFKHAQVNTLVSIIQRGRPEKIRVLISSVNDPNQSKGIIREIEQLNFRAKGNVIHIFEDPAETKLLNKIMSCSTPFSFLAKPCSGYNPYEVGKGQDPFGRPHSEATVQERPYHSKSCLGPEWKPEAIGRNLGRYLLNWPTDRYVKYGPWLAASRDPNNFIGPRILVQEITGGIERRIIATFTDQELYHSRDIIPVKCDNTWPYPFFLLGIINSWLITWWHHRRNPKAKKALFPKILVNDLKNLPIPILNKENSLHVKQHDQMVKLVEQMLILNQQLARAKAEHEKTTMQRHIEATDKQIDRLVYELYGLKAEEIKIVEEATN